MPNGSLTVICTFDTNLLFGVVSIVGLANYVIRGFFTIS